MQGLSLGPQRYAAAAVMIILLAASGTSSSQTRFDLSATEVRNLSIDASGRVMLKDSSGRTSPLPDGQHRLAQRADLIIRHGRVVALHCPNCPRHTEEDRPQKAGGAIPFDDMCSVTYRSWRPNTTSSNPKGFVWNSEVTGWAVNGPQPTFPLGTQFAYDLTNLSALRKVRVSEIIAANTGAVYELAVGETRTYSMHSWGKQIGSFECVDPDPVVVAARAQQAAQQAAASAAAALQQLISQIQ